MKITKPNQLEKQSKFNPNDLEYFALYAYLAPTGESQGFLWRSKEGINFILRSRCDGISLVSWRNEYFKDFDSVPWNAELLPSGTKIEFTVK